MHTTAINRLDLAFQAEPPAGAGAMRVRLWQGEGRDRLVLESAVDIGQVADRVPLTLFFAPEKEAPGQVYAWEVSTDVPLTGLRLCERADGTPALGLYGADWQVVYTGEVSVAERLAPLPRAYVVYAAELIQDDARALARVLDETFDVRNAAIVEQPVDLPPAPTRPATRANVVEYGPQRVVVQAAAEAAGLLLLGDQYYPGWQASVDGQPATIVAANYVWRGVALTPGEHVVVFELRPTLLRVGLALSALAGLCLGLLWLSDGWLSRRGR